MMAGANLFGLINAVLTCVVLGIVATRGGDKTTKNYAATDAGYSITQNPFAADYGANPCIDESGKATLRSDTGQGFGVGLGDLDCEHAQVGAQSGTDVTKGAEGMMDPSVGPIQDYSA